MKFIFKTLLCFSESFHTSLAYNMSSYHKFSTRRCQMSPKMSSINPFLGPVKPPITGKKWLRTIKTQLMVIICTTNNDLRLVQRFILWTGQLLPCSKEAVADSLPKYLLQCSVQCYQVLKGSCSQPYMMQSTIAARYGMFWLFCNRQHGCTVNARH